MNLQLNKSGLLRLATVSTLGMGGVVLIVSFFMQGWSTDFLTSAVCIVSFMLLVLLAIAMNRSIDAGFERSYVKQGEYFTPRLVYADRQLQALSARVGGEYKRGILDWQSFADRYVLASTEMLTPSPIWGRGSLVRKAMQGVQLQVTFGVQPLDPGERGWRSLAIWFILAPSVTVTVDARSSQVGLSRFDANWYADTEIERADGRLVSLALGVAFSAFKPPPMPPAVRSAREPLIEKAAIITCEHDRVEVIGRPLPRAPDEPREYGQGDFEVESLVDLVERTIAFVRALENS
jgi:hypothetical protein